MNKQTVIAALASALGARKRCEKSGNALWHARWQERVEQLIGVLPTGSGIDAGWTIDCARSNETRVVLGTMYHHMTEGAYDGWTSHTVVVKPQFEGIDVRVTGSNRNDIKDYLGDVAHMALTAEAPPYPWADELPKP